MRRASIRAALIFAVACGSPEDDEAVVDSGVDAAALLDSAPGADASRTAADASSSDAAPIVDATLLDASSNDSSAILVDATEMRDAADGSATGTEGGALPHDAGADASRDGSAPAPRSTEPNLKVAFVGDQGNTIQTINVLKTIKAEGAQFLVVLGDFDYADNPDKWDANLTLGLGADFPVFAAVGNHDVAQWPNYKKKLEARLAKIPGARCTGDYGLKMTCTYRGLFFVLSGVGTLGTGHEGYLRDALAADDSTWRVCAWHKNQHDMQVGEKGNEVGWDAYRICQSAGALVMTGHEHSYSRTKTLNALGDASKGHGAFGAFDSLVVERGTPGSTFVTVSGLGGVDVRDYKANLHDDDTWWATWYAANGHVKNGTKVATPSGYAAAFVTFNVDGDPRKARGYAKSVTGVEIDRYEVTRR